MENVILRFVFLRKCKLDMQLKNYIQGDKRGKEANRLEREAMNDPFLQEALDGFDKVTGDHAAIVQRLEKKYSHYAVVPQRRKLAPLPYKRLFLVWSAAASILLLIIGVSYYLFFDRNEQKNPELAELFIKENENRIIYADSEVSQPVEIDEIKQESLSAAKQKKEYKPAVTSRAKVVEKDESVDNNQSEKDIIEKQTIRGKVVDESGEPLIGVSIVRKGTSEGTFTIIDGSFTMELPVNDSSTLIASYLGYESQEINSSDSNQTLILKPHHAALGEVTIVAYGTQKRESVVASNRVDTEKQSSFGEKEFKIGSIKVDTDKQSPFGEKEFQNYCQLNAKQNVCEDKKATVKLSFFINEAGKPEKIEFKSYSCEEAKKEIEKILAISPAWTKTNRKVSMTIKW